MDSVDWTGVAPSDAPIEALTEEVFIRRLNLLSQRARDILILRAAVNNVTGAEDEQRVSPDTCAAPRRGR